MRYYLLLIAKFGYSLGYATSLLGSEFKAQFLKVLGYVGLAAVLAECVLTATTESLGHQSVTIQIILLVAIGMNAGHLGKHVIADDGLVRCHHDTTVALNKARNIVQLIFANVGSGIELVFQNNLNTR